MANCLRDFGERACPHCVPRRSRANTTSTRTKNGGRAKIETSYDYPPIPVRYYDWSAYCYGCYEPGLPVGHGATEQAAIDDLMEQWGESWAEHMDEQRDHEQRDHAELSFGASA